MAGVEFGGEWAGVPTIARELVGLSLGGMLKARPRGELTRGDVEVCRLLRNCCLASTPDRWPWSDCRRRGAGPLDAVDGSEVDGRSASW